jgi:hypothetical protein
LSEDVKQAFSEVLHAAGDSISMVCSIPEIASSLKSPIAETIKEVFLGVASHVEDLISAAIPTHMTKIPLPEEFALDSIFGKNLWTDLQLQAKTDKEKEIINEYMEEEIDDDNVSG